MIPTHERAVRGVTPLPAVFVIAVLAWAAVAHSFPPLGEDAFAPVIVFLQTPIPTEPGRASIGSGFLVATAEHGGRLFLVTAKHVAAGFTAATTVTMRAEGDRPFTVGLPELVGTAAVQSRCTVHDVADIAIVELSSTQSVAIAQQLERHFVLVEILAPERAAPRRGKTLTVFGFPLALGVVDAFSPITRDTKPASGLLSLPCFGDSDDIGASTTPVPMCPYFVTQDPSVGGFSGGPVFDLVYAENLQGGGVMIAGNRSPRIVGVARATISDKTGGKMGVIVPAFYVVETLQKAGVAMPTVAPTPSPAATPRPS